MPKLGYKFSEESKIKMRESHLGRKLSEENRTNISKALKGKQKSEEAKANMKGRHCTEETKAKISKNSHFRSEDHTGKNNPFFGKHHTEETKQKLSELNKLGLMGRKGQHNSPEHKAKASASIKLAVSSPEVQAKRLEHWQMSTEGKLNVSHAQKGRRRTFEQLEKHSEMMRNYWKVNQHPCLGKIWTEEERQCNRLAHTGEHLIAGEKHPCWLGGVSFLPYTKEFNSSLKNKIRARDNFTCQLCTIFENGEKHNVHHIDYIKENSTENNLLTLCRKCNIKVNSNREFWMEFFLSLIVVKQYKQLEEASLSDNYQEKNTG